MPKIKNLELSEQQVESLFQQLSNKMKQKLLKQWLEEMDETI